MRPRVGETWVETIETTGGKYHLLIVEDNNDVFKYEVVVSRHRSFPVGYKDEVNISVLESFYQLSEIDKVTRIIKEYE